MFNVKAKVRAGIKFRREFAYWSIVESIILTLVVIIIAEIAHPRDPFFIQTPFPWIWFAPVMMALAYGFVPGLISVIVIALFFDLQSAETGLSTTGERLYLLGGFLITILCAEFHTLWRKRIRRAQQYSEYANDNLESLSKAYYATVISHDKLERYLINKPATLRGAFHELKVLLDSEDRKITPKLAENFLSLLAYYCSVEVASFYPAKGRKVQTQAIATLGKTSPLNFKDPLIKQACEEEEILYFDIHTLAEETQSQYLLAVPMKNSEGQWLGLIVVESIPFVAYTYETFQIMAILVGYFANTVTQTQRSYPMQQKFPDMPDKFAYEFDKLKQIQLSVNIDATLMAIYFLPQARREMLIDEYMLIKRGTDYTWQVTKDNTIIVFMLMPFTPRLGLQGYIARLDSWFSEKHGIAFGRDTVKYNYHHLSENKPEALLLQLMDACYES